MNIEEAKNILKHMAFDEYEWFIETDEGATRIHPNVADNAIKTVLAELDEISKQNSTQKDTIGEMLKDLDKQDKIINAMALDMIDGELDIQPCCIFKKLNRENCYRDVYYDERACVGCIKQYYEKKVSEE